MKFSHKLSDGVHILAYITLFEGGDLSSAAIAASIESNPSLVRRLMAALVQAGLIQSQPGTAKPTLGRPASEITLLAIYRALEGDRRLLHVDDKTNPRCPVGGNIQATLDAAYQTVQNAAETAMAGITLAQLTEDIATRAKAAGQLPG
ncbi:Rrf2 family transcriptional regulator [Lacticaseibacillus suihuaensis]